MNRFALCLLVVFASWAAALAAEKSEVIPVIDKTGTCTVYTSCTSCSTAAACGWCSSTNSCHTSSSHPCPSALSSCGQFYETELKEDGDYYKNRVIATADVVGEEQQSCECECDKCNAKCECEKDDREEADEKSENKACECECETCNDECECQQDVITFNSTSTGCECNDWQEDCECAKKHSCECPEGEEDVDKDDDKCECRSTNSTVTVPKHELEALEERIAELEKRLAEKDEGNSTGEEHDELEKTRREVLDAVTAVEQEEDERVHAAIIEEQHRKAEHGEEDGDLMNQVERIKERAEEEEREIESLRNHTRYDEERIEEEIRANGEREDGSAKQESAHEARLTELEIRVGNLEKALDELHPNDLPSNQNDGEEESEHNEQGEHNEQSDQSSDNEVAAAVNKVKTFFSKTLNL